MERGPIVCCPGSGGGALPGDPEHVAVGDEVGHAVEHQGLVDAVLLHIVLHRQVVVAGVDQVDLIRYCNRAD